MVVFSKKISNQWMTSQCSQFSEGIYDHSEAHSEHSQTNKVLKVKIVNCL